MLRNPKCETGCGAWERPQVKNPNYKVCVGRGGDDLHPVRAHSPGMLYRASGNLVASRTQATRYVWSMIAGRWVLSPAMHRVSGHLDSCLTQSTLRTSSLCNPCAQLLLLVSALAGLLAFLHTTHSTPSISPGTLDRVARGQV
jgi:hypothetical protein